MRGQSGDWPFYLDSLIPFEFAFGRFVLGFSWEKIASDYNPLEGEFLSIGMLVLTMAPMIAAKIRRVI